MSSAIILIIGAVIFLAVNPNKVSQLMVTDNSFDASDAFAKCQFNINKLIQDHKSADYTRYTNKVAGGWIVRGTVRNTNSLGGKFSANYRCKLFGDKVTEAVIY